MAKSHNPGHPQNTPVKTHTHTHCLEYPLTCRRSDLRAEIARSRNLFVAHFLFVLCGYFFLLQLRSPSAPLCIFVLSSLYYLLRPHFSSFCTFLLYYRPFSHPPPAIAFMASSTQKMAPTKSNNSNQRPADRQTAVKMAKMGLQFASWLVPLCRPISNFEHLQPYNVMFVSNRTKCRYYIDNLTT